MPVAPTPPPPPPARTDVADARHVWHPYTQHAGMAPPPEVVRADGAYLYLRDGRRIFDAICSWWVTLHGHAQPEIAEAVARQARTLDQVIFTTFTHEPAALLAEELVDRLPDELTRVFFSDDGSTAVEVAVKMALQYHANRGERRTKIAAFENAYHGDTFGAMSVSGRGLFTAPFEPHLFDVHRLPDPTTVEAAADPGHVLRALDRLLQERAGELAAVLVEPLLLGVAGMRTYDETLLRAIRERTRAHDVLLIADEVLTGFGRTGPLFACERAAVVPDIICLSKGITGGFMPLGVTVTTEALFQSFLSPDRRRTLFHGHSYTANPIACAAARASLRLLDDASARRRDALGRTHATQIRRLAEHPFVARPRVLGTIAAFDLVHPGEGGATDHGYLAPIGPELARFAFSRGVLIRPLGASVYVMPPYCTVPDELEQVYAVIGDFLASRGA